MLRLKLDVRLFWVYIMEQIEMEFQSKLFNYSLVLIVFSRENGIIPIGILTYSMIDTLISAM